MITKALGKNYFENKDFPLHVCRVVPSHYISHQFDLTEVEHFHDFTELVFVIKGKGVQIIEKQEFVVSAGDVFVLQKKQRHYFKDAQNLEIINVMFSLDKNHGIVSSDLLKLEGYNALFVLESQYRANHHFKNNIHLNRSELAKFEFIINAMINEQNNKQEGFKYILKNKLEELIVLLSRHYSNLDNTEAKSLIRIGKVIDFLENNFDQKIYLYQLANIACMSPRNFQRIFQKAIGEKPSVYIMQIRLQKARSILRNTNATIASIASDCGFGDSNYFIKCFKKQFGITPVKFRMSN